MKISEERIFEAINNACKDVFEKYLFMDLSEESRVKGLTLENEYYWVGKISFEGDCRGIVLLYCSEDIVNNMLNDFLGVEDEDEGLEIEDGFNELTNIVAGNILTDLSKGGLVLKQGLPETTGFKDFNLVIDPGSSTYTTEFSFDENRVAVQVILYSN
ncbi:hypothetical protein DRQ09_01055 [candidate division KSB1 bacterium]|nr:MAG: hypothetical protein DRQ09_01055 [candidate division KSB1 bacterium]